MQCIYSSYSLAESPSLELMSAHAQYRLNVFCTNNSPFSSPEAALLLVSTKNRDLWPGPTTFDPVLNSFVNTIDWEQNQSDLSDLTLSMSRVTGSPWIADFRCWTWPEVAILGADQREGARPLGTRMIIAYLARVFYEQIVNEAQPSWLSHVENEGE